jgi:asparagine synthase (glutamine-hydrolysing)
MQFTGWARLDGRVLDIAEFEAIIEGRAPGATRLEGEFFFKSDRCRARDWFGIIPGDCPRGTIICNNRPDRIISPVVGDPDLEVAIITAVRQRSDEGVTALSGGVDSSLVAALAGLPCITVGFKESHDLKRGLHAARELGLSCEPCIIDDRMVADHLPTITGIAATDNPVDIGIAATQYFISWWAGELGFRRILSGQGADEQFGGYARYLSSPDLARDLSRDLDGIVHQIERDQSVAAHFGCYFSMPYLDARVVRAAGALDPSEKIRNGVRKYALREVARHYIPPDIAASEKKAMQYGSGIWSSIRRLARHNGYKTSLKDYVNHLKWME